MEGTATAELVEKLEISRSTGANLVTASLQEEELVDVSSMSGEELRTKALDLRRTINVAAIELAEVLHEIYQSEKWREFEAFDSFEKYVETELEIGYRSAMYSIKIISTMKSRNISMEQARQLGWGRLRSILPHITARNVGSLLEMAASRSVRQIQEELKEGGLITTSVPETHKIVFNCSASEATIIFDTLDEAKRRLNTESLSSALEFICQEWTIANEGETSQTSLQDIINFVERNYGVTLIPSETSQEIADMVE